MIDKNLQSRVEALVGVAVVMAAVFLAFDVFGRMGLLVFPEQILVMVVGFGLWIVFTTIRFSRQREEGSVPWYDWLAAICSVAYVPMLHLDTQ